MHPSLLLVSRMVRPLAVSMALALAVWSVPSVHAADSHHERGVIGKWRLVKVLDSADISSLDDQEAQQLVGRIFTISKKTVKIGPVDDCLPPGFEARTVEPGRYVREWAHASAGQLGLPDPVTVVDLGCTNAFINSPKHIVVFWKGWFFDAKRMRQPVSTANHLGPQAPEDDGYYVYGTPVKGAGQHAHPDMLSLLFWVEHQWQPTDLRRFGIGNISLDGGPNYEDHKSHVNGLQVDVRALRIDGHHTGIEWRHAGYDRAATARLIGLFRTHPAVKKILFNDIAIPGVTPWRGHDNHFHVDIRA